MGQKVNPIAVRLNFNRFSDSSWFSDYYYSTLIYQDLNFRQYLHNLRRPNTNKLGFRSAKCIIHHFPKRSLVHLFCLSDPRKKTSRPLQQFGPFRRIRIRTDADAPKTPNPKVNRKLLAPGYRAVETRVIVTEPNVTVTAPLRLGSEETVTLTAPVGPRQRAITNTLDTTIDASASNPLARAYWLKSSILQKKRALVNLHRLLSDRFAASRLPVAGGPTRNMLTHLASSDLGGPLRIVAPSARHLADFVSLTSRIQPCKRKPNNRRFSWPDLLHPECLNPVLPSLPSLPSHEGGGGPPAEGGGGPPAEGGGGPPAAGVPPEGGRPTRNGPWLATGALAARKLGPLADPKTSVLGSQHHAIAPEPVVTNARYFNFYAIHYFFMHKMGDFLGRLPHRIVNTVAAPVIRKDITVTIGEPWPEARPLPGSRRRFDDRPGNRVYPDPTRFPGLTSRLASSGLRGRPNRGIEPGLRGSLTHQKRVDATKEQEVVRPEVHPTAPKRPLRGREPGLVRFSNFGSLVTRPELARSASDHTLRDPKPGFTAEGRSQARASSLQTDLSRLTDRPNSIWPTIRVRHLSPNRTSRVLINTGPGTGCVSERALSAEISQPHLKSTTSVSDHGNRVNECSFFGSVGSNQITKSLDFYLSNVHYILSQNTNTFISMRPIKVHSVFQCASLVAQEVACKLEQKKSFRLICRLIFQQLTICNYIKGIRITCSGRLNGAEIAKTECRKFGETSLHVFSDKIDYAQTKASTPYGILGVKVWISYI